MLHYIIRIYKRSIRKFENTFTRHDEYLRKYNFNNSGNSNDDNNSPSNNYYSLPIDIHRFVIKKI